MTTLHPSSLTTSDLAGAAGINVFCFLATPNHAWNLNDLPTRRSDGSLTARPVAALDLHYLVTCYGDDRALVPQRLLGRAVVALQATSVLTRDVVAAALDLYDDADDTTFLADSDLADEVELVKLSPTPLSLEEMSKLWGVLDAPYLLSLTYLATVVLIAADVTPTRRAARSCSAQLTVTPAAPPQIASLATDPLDQPILAGTTLVISGSGLVPTTAGTTSLRIGPVELLPGDGATALAVRATLDGTVPAGLHALTVRHRSVAGPGRLPAVAGDRHLERRPAARPADRDGGGRSTPTSVTLDRRPAPAGRPAGRRRARPHRRRGAGRSRGRDPRRAPGERRRRAAGGGRPAPQRDPRRDLAGPGAGGRGREPARPGRRDLRLAVVDAAMTAGPVVEEPTAADPRAALLAELAVIRCRLRGDRSPARLPRRRAAGPDAAGRAGGRVRPERVRARRSCCSLAGPELVGEIARRDRRRRRRAAAHVRPRAARAARRALERAHARRRRCAGGSSCGCSTRRSPTAQPAGRRRAGAPPPARRRLPRSGARGRSPGPPSRCASRRRRSCDAGRAGGDGVGGRSRGRPARARSTRTSRRSPRRRPRGRAAARC